jgi:predicted amidohydrolase YtcJ
MPEQKLSLEQALRGSTMAAAHAGFAEEHIGTLERGKFADFILIDRDIFAGATPQQIRDTKVLETWIAGEKAWAAK